LTCVLFAHRDAGYFVPKLQARFPALRILTAPDLPEATDLLPVADVIMATGHHFNDERLARAGQLKWIQAMTTGTDAIVCSRRLQPHVLVTSTRGIHGPQMAEMAFLYMLSFARDARRIYENQKLRLWQRWEMVRLYGKTAVILGLGLAAEALAPRCKAFGMSVIGVTGTRRPVPGFDRLYRYDELSEAAALADFLIVLTPYSPKNDSFINAQVLAAMKPTAVLINLARGGLVDENALFDALRSKRIGGAGLDVFRTEPLPPESPFWRLENVIITAHNSGSSDDNLAMTWPIIEGNMARFLEGRHSEMINLVPH
jgi:D-2-hydroxyacid dehydrogenase (NADP+)